MTKKHDENCNCGNEEHDHCGCGCDDEMEIITLTLDDDTELECNVLGTFEVDDYEYIALVPFDDDQVLLYRYEEDEEGFELINIEDDEEFEVVSEAFYTLFVEEDLDFYDDEDIEDCDEDYEDLDDEE
jgi:uncharacterized protein YrzB (UPF0473 family)